MQINTINATLDTVYDILSEVLGDYHYILTDCITSVEHVTKDSKYASAIPTLAIDAKGKLYISEEFCQKYLRDELDFTAVLLHEFLHAALADTDVITRISKSDPERDLKLLAANISFDCRINALIHCLFSESLSLGPDLPSRLLSNTFIHIYNTIEQEESSSESFDPIFYNIRKLLFYGNDTFINYNISYEMATLYKSFYAKKQILDHYPLYVEVLNYLRKNPPPKGKSQVKVLGSHGQGIGDDSESSDSSTISSLDKETKEQISQAIADSIRDKELRRETLGNGNKGRGQQAGTGDEAVVSYVPVFEKQVTATIPKELFRKLALREISHNIKLSLTEKEAKWASSPVIPSVFAKTDLLLSYLDTPPLLWKKLRYTKSKVKTLLPIYFDISGSMTSYIPYVLDILLNIDDDIEYIWCFSDYVHKHSIQDLKNRLLTGSGGTSFNSVVSHIAKNNYRNVLIITDGYDEVTVEKPACLQSVSTILVPQSTPDNWFSREFPGSTYDIEQLVEGK